MNKKLLQCLSLVLCISMIAISSACNESNNSSVSEKASSQSIKTDKKPEKPTESSEVSEVKKTENSKNTKTPKPKDKNTSSSKPKPVTNDYVEVFDDYDEDFYDSIDDWTPQDDYSYEDIIPEIEPPEDKEPTEFVPKINKITSLDEFLQFQKSVRSGCSYKGETVNLECDIDLKGIEWMPIGISGASFKGKFSGNNHTISNLTITTAKNSYYGSSTAYVGLFGYVEGGEITGINLENADINLNGLSGAEWGYIGTVVGYIWDRNGNIGMDSCKATGKINVTDNSNSMVIIGGIAGGFDCYRTSEFYLNKIHSEVNITAKSDIFSGGGIAGHLLLGNHDSSKHFVSDLIYKGSVICEARMCETAGLAGVFATQSHAIIKNCFIQLGLGMPRSGMSLGLAIGDETTDCESLTLTNIYAMGIYNENQTKLWFVGKKYGTVHENNCVHTTQLPENVPFDTKIWDLTDPSSPKFIF